MLAFGVVAIVMIALPLAAFASCGNALVTIAVVIALGFPAALLAVEELRGD
jgi:hypothetical protein